MIDDETFARLDLRSAVAAELITGSRLMPRRADLLSLSTDVAAVAAWIGPRVQAGTGSGGMDLVLADKGWRGARPLHTMTLEDRVLYRALVQEIQIGLPEPLRQRGTMDDFKRSPLKLPGVAYVTKTDVTAYYEYVDHEILLAELLAQTGEDRLITALGELLLAVMGRRLGLPQVSRTSDVLGDTYIDVVRRRMVRRGFATYTYSDDFRIATKSLGEARAAIEVCAQEVRRLGLVLNERKTYTYGRDHYFVHLTAFRDAELKLFEDNDVFLLTEYVDDEAGLADAEGLMLSSEPVGAEVDQTDMVRDDSDADQPVEPEADQVAAAQRAWNLWLEETEDEDAQSGLDAAITQSLLGNALPVLGAHGDPVPLANLLALLRYEPALTPQTCAYLLTLARHGRSQRVAIRDALDAVVEADLLSTWQGVWIAYTAGALRGSRASRPQVLWLERVLQDNSGALAAYAALSLGRLGHGQASVLANALDRVAPPWRGLVYLGLCQLDSDLAERVADNPLDRLLLTTAQA